MKCDEAYSLLNKAFVSHYPQYEHATENGGTGYRDWRAHIVPLYYPDADLCSDVENLQFSEMLAKRIGAKIGAYVYGKQWRENLPINYNETWASRDWMIGGIITLASDGHHPALIELAKLHQRGDVFEAGPEAEYYLLKRACHYNVRCEEIMSRIAELEAKLPPDLQREVAAKAMKDEFDHKEMGLTADE